SDGAGASDDVSSTCTVHGSNGGGGSGSGGVTLRSRWSRLWLPLRHPPQQPRPNYSSRNRDSSSNSTSTSSGGGGGLRGEVRDTQQESVLARRQVPAASAALGSRVVAIGPRRLAFDEESLIDGEGGRGWICGEVVVGGGCGGNRRRIRSTGSVMEEKDSGRLSRPSSRWCFRRSWLLGQEAPVSHGSSDKSERPLVVCHMAHKHMHRNQWLE
ncbi:unnamed protein product, partial [Ectocarpus sp. 4 AP-2014]